MTSNLDSLQRLRDGNRRFVAGESRVRFRTTEERRSALVNGQNPFAVILGCADSRVPAEIVFDQGLGDLFVVRVAGNIVAPSLVGSVEFAVTQLGTRIVIVLGHSGCGAVSATIRGLQNPHEPLGPNLQAIDDRIRPAVESLWNSELRNDPDELLLRAVEANVRASVGHLKEESPLLNEMVESEELLIVGAEYSLESGLVEFHDEVTAEP